MTNVALMFVMFLVILGKKKVCSTILTISISKLNLMFLAADFGVVQAFMFCQCKISFLLYIPAVNALWLSMCSFNWKTFFSNKGHTILIYAAKCCAYQWWKLEII